MSGLERSERSAEKKTERRRGEELATMNRVARRVSASLDLQETLDTIVETAAELVPCALAEKHGQATLENTRHSWTHEAVIAAECSSWPVWLPMKS